MKHYTDRDAAALMDEVERQDGAFLGETCASDEITYEMPSGEIKHVLGTGCEEEALFLVSYDPARKVSVNEPILEDDPSPDAPQGRRRQKRDADDRLMYRVVVREERPSDTLSTARVCANDDLMREWPRFRHVITQRDPARGF